MASHSKGRGYVSLFDDLNCDPQYYVKAYLRVKDGGVRLYGKWREIKCFPNGFWDKDAAKVLVRYFAFTENGWKTKEEICQNINTRVLRDNRLAGACKVFRSSTYDLLSYCFPEWRIEPWELRSCPNAFWNEPENCAAVLKWIIREEGLEEREVFCSRISAALFKKYGVGKAMVRSGGLYNLINYTFPGEYKPWHFNKVAKVTEEMVRDAVRWMIDEELGWSHDEVCEKLKVQTFKDFGIDKVLQKGARHSPIVALQIAYPGEYTREMLRNSENPFIK